MDASRIRSPRVRYWATEDTAFPIAKVDQLRKKLSDAKIDFEFHRYRVRHAFANETADSNNLPSLKHDAVAAQVAWRRAIEFFGNDLK